ncbi:carbon-nitrogen hydrolase [Bordetella genomosp. 12]|uniref:Carbon-nitrogen hydrolase n=1 Tax=Bordetella genomosp. 12 TaxID=463035 RepID=A0A261VDP8_9BORD|nr:carbon-nitrogen hydrolase [Bordetella genomosp. 12]
MKVSLIQTNPTDDRQRNIRQAIALMEEAMQTDAPDLLILPENFDFYGGAAGEKLKQAQPAPGGEAYAAIQQFAEQHGVWVHAGSLVEKIEGDTRVYNTSVVFDRKGKEVARYRKIHLFDITSPDGIKYHESATVKPGEDIVTYDLEGFTIGCAICYDIRFAELFIALADRGADVIVLPAAFALGTGKDHWEVLGRARAIETQTYFLAPGQIGTHHANGVARQTYGHSLACDPWGHVIAKASDSVGFVTVRLTRAELDRARGLIPMREHRRLGRHVEA